MPSGCRDSTAKAKCNQAWTEKRSMSLGHVGCKKKTALVAHGWMCDASTAVQELERAISSPCHKARPHGPLWQSANIITGAAGAGTGAAVQTGKMRADVFGAALVDPPLQANVFTPPESLECITTTTATITTALLHANMTTKSPKTLVVTFKLSPDALSQFPHQPAPVVKEQVSKASTPTPTPQIVEPTPAATPAHSTADMNGSTPASLAPPSAKRKGPKPGSKRSAAQMEAGSNAGTPKQPKAKPGPKRKKMGDIINDPNSKGPFAAPAAINKAGPKANLGAINERLRALDRSGAKCRRWEKKGFQVRSFTGVLWQVPTYQPGRGSAFADDVKSDSTGTSDSKLKDESSAISDKSGINGDTTPIPTPMNGLESSPAPIPA
ncbi:hypothetical protein P3342_013433 [Pyrenophora teres f. teres]|nr:hypothetical protein P3342_013433 [Pyrenophora teres f. teres]